MEDIYPLEQYPNYKLEVLNESGNKITPNMIWRKNGKIYLLDDPDTTYKFVYNYQILDPIFHPMAENIFNNTKPTITIIYEEQVKLLNAFFGNINIIDQITSIDNKTFIYTSKLDISNGTYSLNITSQDKDGNNLTNTAIYNIQAAAVENEDEKKNDGFPWMIVILITVIIIILSIFILYKKGFIYIEYDE
jgi:hypothetical protein